ncbi:MAG: response regulator [Lachnospiraceae bacterium]|nr:response regulator [Lachnospiraceae bacterium]
MYQVVLTFQIFSIIALFIETIVVFKNWRSTVHSWLFLSCTATLINNIGYLFELLSSTEEAYMTALKISYFGRIWTIYALFMFVAEFVRAKLPRYMKYVLSAINTVTYLIVITTEKTGLYYAYTTYTHNGSFPIFYHVDGIWHMLWSGMIMFYTVFGMTILILAYVREKRSIAKTRIFMVILAIATQTFFVFIETFKLIPFIEQVYDVTMLSFPIAAVFMFIAIFRYDLLDTEDLAKEYVVNELSEGIIAVDLENDVRFYNKSALSIFPALTVNPESVIRRIRRRIKNNKPLKVNGRIYSAEENTLMQNGNPSGTLFSLADDTEHFRYMSELEEQKTLADAANKAKSAFLANMSHEIRTPINAVLGMDEMILRESREKDIISYASDIRSAGRTLLSLINDILDFSKIEEGKMEIIPTQYELSSLIGDLVNMIKDRAEKKGLHFEADVESTIPHVLYGDEIRIKQVALNLLTNAVKYTETGTVKLEVSHVKHENEEIDLCISVSDTGIGMKPEDMTRLFSPFSRIEEKRNRTIEGTGLGMSIVEQLLALMDSKLDVQSRYGTGSTFSFAVRQKVIKDSPIGDFNARYEKAVHAPGQYRELFHAPDARVLVVDDNEVNLTVITNLLKGTQIKVDTVLSGREAIVQCTKNDYDVCFIDHMMPEMDGIETLHELQKQDAGRGISPVYVALTANAVSGARERYLNAGFTDYVSKPVDGARLEELLRSYLPSEKIKEVKKDETGTAVTDNKDRLRNVLVVDDDEVICVTVKEILGRSFIVQSCMDGNEALIIAKNDHPDLILLDINMSGMNGFEVFEKLKENGSTKDIPVMYITADEDREKEAAALKNGAQDLIRKPFVPEVLLQRCKRTIALDRYQKNLQGEVDRQTDRAERLNQEMMFALSRAVDAKDHYTNGHSERVASYSAEIARRLGKSFEEQKKIYEMGLLHDIGKIGVPEEIINKTAKLTDEEFERIKEHTTIGYNILKDLTDMPELSKGARSHHEKYDGSGYPDHLSGDAIPEEARIICVADCYDAMTSTRTYSKPKDQQVVRAEIERCKGKHFDPVIADVMIAMIDDDKDYIMNELNDGRSIWKGRELLLEPVKIRAEDTVSGSEEAQDIPDGDTAEADIPSRIENIEQIDVKAGIANCGGKESFLSVLDVFGSTAGQKADEIEKLYNENDIENYTIKVHALKSSARIIGAAKLSDRARLLEEAGKKNDTDYISANTKELLSMYRALEEELSSGDKEPEKRPGLSDEERKEAFNTISEIAGSMDFGMMEDLLKDLEGYDLSEGDRKILKDIRGRLMDLDWDGITEITAGIIGS